MNKKFFLPLLLAAAVCLPSHGQSTGENEGRFRQDYLPVSPTTAALMRRVQCPVNYSTGRIDLSIPLYEIRTRDFTLPLTLKYAGGGVKVDDTDDLAGLGWTLDFGPTMGRSIQGMPDEKSYLNSNSRYGDQDKVYLKQLAEGIVDEMPDLFYYSTLDEQGSFLFRPADRTPVQIPLTAARIQPPDSYLNSFTVTDGRGNTYLFDEQETTWSEGGDQLTGWKLKTLTSPRGERMDFEYTPFSIDHIYYYDYYAVEDRYEQPGELGKSGYWMGVEGNLTFFRTNGYELQGDSLWGNFLRVYPDSHYGYRLNHPVSAKLPTRISYPGGQVTFKYALGVLTEVHVYEGSTETLSASLTYHKVRSDSRSLLKRVTFTDRVTGKNRSYDLSYYDETGSYGFQTNAVDRYGYYNGHEENTDRVERRVVEFQMVPNGSHTHYYARIGGADRSPNAFRASRHALSELRYPDGSLEKYSYGLNRYTFYKETYAGGLRVERIECYDTKGELKNVRRFVYDGKNTKVPSVQFEDETMKHYMYTNHTDEFRYRLYPSTPVADAGTAAGTHILYRRVTEYVDDSDNRTLSSRTYTYKEGYSFPYIVGGIVYDNGRSYKKGLLESVADRHPETGDTLRLEAFDSRSLYLSGLPKVSGRTVRTANIVVPAAGVPGTEVDRMQEFNVYYHSLPTDESRPVVTRETLTDAYGGRPTTRTTERTFGGTENDVRTALPLTETVREADGTRRRTCYTYPYHSTEAAAQAMTAANDLKRPLSVRKETLSADGDSVQDWRTDFTYKTLSGVGSAVLSAAASGGHEGSALTDESYTAHDAQGNICEIRRRDGSLTTVLYGYHYRHPVAVIEGAAYSDVIAALGISYTALQDLTGTTLRNRLLGLRTAFPAPCRVTVYDYAPTRGPVYRNDPNGNVTTWSYDGFGRMTEARDAEGAVMQYNEYGEY